MSEDVVGAARAACTDAIRVLASIMRDEGAPTASRVAAAEKLLDRGYGKPAQTVDMNLNAPSLAEMNEAELDRRIAVALAGEKAAARSSQITH